MRLTPRRHQRDLDRWRPRRDEDVERLQKVRLSPDALPDPNLAQSLKGQAIVDNVSTLDDADVPVARLGPCPTPGHRESLPNIGAVG